MYVKRYTYSNEARVAFIMRYKFTIWIKVKVEMNV